MIFKKNDDIRSLPKERFLKETDEEYHSKSKSGEYISSHLLNTFSDNPLKYHLMTTGQIPFPADSSAFAFGRACHCYILEGSFAFNERYIVNDGVLNPKTGKPYGRDTKAYLDWVATLPKGVEVVTNEEYDIIRAMSNAVSTHEEACALLSDAEPERILRTQIKGVGCQAKFDGIGMFCDKVYTPFLIDLKTVADIGDFERDIFKYRYDSQCAFYRLVFNAVCGFKPDCYIIAVEKQEPFTVGVWQLAGELVDDAEQRVLKKLGDLCECLDNDQWNTGYETIRVLQEKRRF